MTRWQQFLTSLSTPGGNLFLLVTFVVLLLVLVFHILHSSGDAQVTTVILSTFSAFSGALLQAFKGRSSDLPNTSTLTTNTAPPEPKS